MVFSWFQRLFQKDLSRFAEELVAAINSTSSYRMRWAKKLMRISDKMKFDKKEQSQLFQIGIEYHKKREELNFQLPHLPDILACEVKVIRMKRDLAWREILGNRYEAFNKYYSKK